MADQSHAPRDGRRARSSRTPSRASRGPAAASSNVGSPLREALDSNRAFVPLLIFAAIALLFLARLVFLQVIVAPDYSAQAQQARTVGFDVEPRRGTIYDRNGTVLATSVEATTIYANPSEVEDARDTALKLADVLGGSADDYEGALESSDSSFAFVKRKADVADAEKVKELGLDGIYFISDTKRIYPNKQIGAQIIGLTDVDGNGLSGLEAYYDDILSGQAGRYEAERGRDGTPIPGGVHEERAAVDGQDIIISIDIELQQYLETRLQEGVSGLNATGGSSVVMDGGTGEIYAAASLPLLNPDDRDNIEAGATELKAVTDLFEPGSIFKTVSAMSVLEAGTMTPDTQLFCPATLTADGYTISDAHERGDAWYTLRQILDQSSNIGISLATENATVGDVSGFQNLYNKILEYNLHEKTGVDYPGEGEAGTDVLGYMTPFANLSKVGAYNVSFGQGISVTPLQMTRFYGALVNDGVECVPHFLISEPQSGQVAEYGTEDVVDDKAAISDITGMLKTVVTEGTGKAAAIDGFSVAGKTSTAEIYDEENGGYRKGVYNLCFTGFLADSSSQLVCFVGANEVPGDGVVTPIFRDIMSTAIDRFKITSE